jgi:hypothetical protein
MSAPHPFLPFRLGCHFALSRNRPHRKLADLTALRRELARLVSTCEDGTVGDCRIIEALAPIP